MKVYIGVPTAEYGRHATFYDYLNFLEKPAGTIGASFHTNAGAHNRNLIIDDAIASDCSHILFIDDDMAFAPNSLIKLIRHDLDIVSGLYFNRVYPHPPVIFDALGAGFVRHWMQDGESGLIEIGACGFGFVLVKTSVFVRMEPPYVRHGELEVDKRNEDIGFCIRARAAGYRIYCDLDVVIGHMGVATFWPSYVNGVWYTAVDTGSNELMTVKQQTSKIEIKTPLYK